MTAPTVNAADNPALAQAMSEEALRSADQSGEQSPPPVPSPPLDPTVNLPGGYIDLMRGVVHTTAEVRELTGEDEEALARAGDNAAKMIDLILQRAVVSVGGEAATPEILGGLLAADRDTLVIGIRRVTFGDEVTLNVRCPNCGSEHEDKISLTNDIPTSSLADPIGDRSFRLNLPSGRSATVTLVTGETQRALTASNEINQAVLNTRILKDCVQDLDGFPVVSDDQVRKLSIRDRNTILEEIRSRTPGPKLREVKRPCPACEVDIPLPLSLVDLFRL